MINQLNNPTNPTNPTNQIKQTVNLPGLVLNLKNHLTTVAYFLSIDYVIVEVFAAVVDHLNLLPVFCIIGEPPVHEVESVPQNILWHIVSKTQGAC